MDRRPGHVGADAGLHHERPDAAAQVEAGAHAVGVALASRRFRFSRLTNSPPRIGVEDQQRVIIRRRSRRADVADAQLRLRGARPRHHAERRRRASPAAAPAPRRDRSSSATPPRATDRTSSPAASSSSSSGRSPTTISVEPAGANIARVQRARASTVIAVSAASEPERQVAVGMRSVQHPRERALGQRAGVVLHLLQPLEPQVANAVEVVVRQVRRGHDLVNQRQTRSRRTDRASSGRRRPRPCRLRYRGRRRSARRDRRSRAPTGRGCLRRADPAVIDTRPCASAGSTADPPGTSSTIDTTGTERCRTARSSSPLASVRRTMRGK